MGLPNYDDWLTNQDRQLGDPDAEDGRHLLVVVAEASEAAQIEAFIRSIGGVESVEVHGKGCCCQNCPWRGNHE